MADPNGLLAIIIQSCMDAGAPLALGLAFLAIMVTLHRSKHP